MIYIVSGFMRSGTSAMMSALIAGGLEAEWSPDRDDIIDESSDEFYKMNPDKLYEIPLKEYGDIDFPLKYQSKLIKVMVWGLEGLTVNSQGYKIILMKRDKEEIRQSCEAALGTDVRKNPFWKDYDTRMARTEEMLKNRKDVVDYRVVRYREDLIEKPLNTFTLLSSILPIDPVKAVSVVNKDLCRFRLENLTVGI